MNIKTLLLLSTAFLLLLVTACSRSTPAADAVELDWLTDAEAALALSAETGKPLLMNFTGSDWCTWCIKLEREVFNRPEFAAYSEQELVLLKLDFPRRTPIAPELAAQNEELAVKFGVQGFPTILIMDSDGALKARTGYRRGGAESYVAHLRGLLN